MISADGTRAVVKSNYREIRTGAPPFGEIVVTGGKAATSGRTFGEAMAFSDDSRYLGIAEYAGLMGDAGLHTRVVVFDLEEGTELIAFDLPGGLIQDVRWSPGGALSVGAWSYPGGRTEAESVWTRPEPGPGIPTGAARAPRPPPRFGAARAIWMLAAYFLVQLAVGLVVGIGVAVYAQRHGMSGPRAVAWLRGGGLFPIAIAASLASAASLAALATCALVARLRTGSLLPSIALHGAYNLMVVVAVYAQAA